MQPSRQYATFLKYQQFGNAAIRTFTAEWVPFRALDENPHSPIPCFTISSKSNKRGDSKLTFEDSYILRYNAVQTGINS